MNDVGKSVNKFKIEMLRKLPFYGDIIVRIPIEPDDSAPTAYTNGRVIRYSRAFLGSLTEGEVNFVLLHEVLHIMLKHCIRTGGRKKDVWNVACDMVVNNMLTDMEPRMNELNIAFERPSQGIFEYVQPSETVESIYSRIIQYNDNCSFPSGKVCVGKWGNYERIVTSDNDLQEAGLTMEEAEALGQEIDGMIKEVLNRIRGTDTGIEIPEVFLSLVSSRRLKWSSILRDFLTRDIDDEASYSTPERKYLHMDLIIPGYGYKEECLEEIWVFADCSGSIMENDRNQFLTQVYRIAAQFHCRVNICYWDTKVEDVYLKVQGEKNILSCVPHHSGGTQIQCIYEWLEHNKVRPEVMLILTDGICGEPMEPAYKPWLRRKTIFVLTQDTPLKIQEELGRYGRITTL